MLCDWDENRTCINCGWRFPHDHLPLPRTNCPHPNSPKGLRRHSYHLPPARTQGETPITDVYPLALPSPAIVHVVPRPKGPGDFLHDIIRFWLRQQPTVGCGCEDKIAQMNAWGVAGCREHLDEIAGWLIVKAREDKWKLASAPGVETLVRLMVKRAIRKAERAEAKRLTSLASESIPDLRR